MKPSEYIQETLYRLNLSHQIDAGVFKAMLAERINMDSVLIKDTLVLTDMNDSVFPNSLYSEYNIEIENSRITSLPAEMVSEFSEVALRNCRISNMPKALSGGDGVFIGNCIIESFCPQISGGDGIIHVENSEIRSMPSNCRMDSDVRIAQCKIDTMPEQLKVLDVLNLTNCSIQRVGGVRIENSEICSMPSNCSIEGNVRMTQCKINTIPDRLTVSGDLDFVGCPIQRLPDELECKSLALKDCPITQLPENLRCERVCIDAKMLPNIDLNGFDTGKLDVINNGRVVSYAEYAGKDAAHVCVSFEMGPFRDTRVNFTGTREECEKYISKNWSSLATTDKDRVEMYDKDGHCISMYAQGDGRNIEVLDTANPDTTRFIRDESSAPSNVYAEHDKSAVSTRDSVQKDDVEER